MRTLLWSNKKTVDYLEKELRKGMIVLGDGDTVLGLLADLSLQGIMNLDYIKKRSKKPYLILVHDYKKALNLIEYDEKQFFQIEKIMNICWPGPVTLIFKVKKSIPLFMKADNDTIALRVPDHVQLLQLLDRFDGLFSTSANSAGEPVPRSIEQVDSDMVNFVNCIVRNDEHTKQTTAMLPSTIIDCTSDRLIVVRQGAFSIERLVDVCGDNLTL